MASSAAGSSGNDDGSPAAETKGDDDGSPAAAAAESAAQTKGDDDGSPAAAAAEAQTKGDDDGSPAGGAAVAPSAADGAAPPAGQKALPVEVKLEKAVETPSVEGLLCIDFDEDDEAEASAAAVPPSDLPQSAAIVAAAPSDSDLPKPEVPQKPKPGVALGRNKERLPCPICNKIYAQMPKNSKYCYVHKESVDAAFAQAKKEGEEAATAFKAKEQDSETLPFRKLILDFERACPARGRGRPRAKYSFAMLIESWKAETKQSKEKKKKWMDYIDFTVFQKEKRLKTQEQADRLWFALLDNPAVSRDMGGLDADGKADVRLLIVKGDYETESESLAYAKEMQCELEKKRKVTEKDVDKMFDDLSTGHMPKDDVFFAEFAEAGRKLSDSAPEHLLTTPQKRGGGIASSPNGEPGSGGDGPPTKKAKSQAAMASAQTSAAVALDRAVADEREEAPQCIELVKAALQEVPEKWASQLSFQAKVAEVRCQALKNYHDQSLNNDQLAHGIEQNSLRLLPVTMESLAGARGLEIGASPLYEAADLSEVKLARASLMETLSVVKSLRMAAVSAAKDVQKAVAKLREKEKKEQASKSAQEAKQKMAAAKAELKRSPDTSSLPQMKTVFELDWSELVQEKAVASPITAAGEFLAGRPFLSKASDGIKQVCDSDPNLQTFLARFIQQAPIQDATRAKGRALAPMKSSMPCFAPLRAQLRLVIPASPEAMAAETQVASSVTCFWNLPSLKIVYFERALAGTIRYQHRGDSEALVIPFAAAHAVWPEAASQEALFEKIRLATRDQLKAMNDVSPIHKATISQGSVLVVPAACIIVERSMQAVASYGFKAVYLDAAHRTEFSSALAAVAAADKAHPQLPQMQQIAACYEKWQQ